MLLRRPTVAFLSAQRTLMYFVVATADGDRHGWSDGGSDRPRGRRGLEPSLPEGRQAEAVSQAEKLKGFRRGGGHVLFMHPREGHKVRSRAQRRGPPPECDMTLQ